MNVYMWFLADETNRTTYKIVAVASDLGAARRQAMKCTGDPRARRLVENTEPEAWRGPWAECNIAHNGKAGSWCAGEVVG